MRLCGVRCLIRTVMPVWETRISGLIRRRTSSSLGKLACSLRAARTIFFFFSC